MRHTPSLQMTRHLQCVLLQMNYNGIIWNNLMVKKRLRSIRTKTQRKLEFLQIRPMTQTPKMSISLKTRSVNVNHRPWAEPPGPKLSWQHRRTAGRLQLSASSSQLLPFPPLQWRQPLPRRQSGFFRLLPVPSAPSLSCGRFREAAEGPYFISSQSLMYFLLYFGLYCMKCATSKSFV